MCVTMGPARLSRTALYVGEVFADGSKPVHAVGYQNKVQNLPAPGGPTGNAMILPFPPSRDHEPGERHPDGGLSAYSR